jgi:glycerophosphoryl diester phosphodiesterase
LAPRPTLAQRYEGARERGRPLIGGHRGNPAEHPENTLASFRSAIELGVDIIECDVHMSADGELVVIHDHTLERTTDGQGLVRDHSSAELRELDAGSGEPLPFLREVCDLSAEHDMPLAIELKQIPIPYPGIEEKVVQLLRDTNLLDISAVISFQHRSVQVLKQLEPRLQTGLLEGARPIDPVRMMREANADLYAPHYGAMDPELVEEMHRAGKAVGVWTVDDGAGVLWCRICKPDSVFTNRPREIAPLLLSLD